MNKQNWIEKSHDSWSVFKIMGELVEGYEKLSELGPCVSIFGSARTQEDDPFYKQTVKIAKKIVGMGLGVITGGGPGIMEAANKGAQQAGGISVGLNIDLPFEQTHNEFIDSDKLIDFDYFFVRKVMFVRYAQAFIVMPGGFGTLDELFEALTLIQTKKIQKFPVILVGSEFWNGCIDWLKNKVCNDFKNVSSNEMFLFELVDSEDEIIDILNEFYNQKKFFPKFLTLAFLSIVILLMCLNKVFTQNYYEIKSSLHPDSNYMDLEQKIIFHNNSENKLNHLILYDWNNAYSSNDTPLSKKLYEEYNLALIKSDKKERGFTIINKITTSFSNLSWERTTENPDLIKIFLKMN